VTQKPPESKPEPGCPLESELTLLTEAIDKVKAFEAEALQTASELATQRPILEKYHVLLIEAADESQNLSSAFWSQLFIGDSVCEAQRLYEYLCRKQDYQIEEISAKYPPLVADHQAKESVRGREHFGYGVAGRGFTVVGLHLEKIGNRICATPHRINLPIDDYLLSRLAKVQDFQRIA